MIGLKVYTSDFQTKLYDIQNIRSVDLNFDIFSNPDSKIELLEPFNWLKQFQAIQVYDTSVALWVDTIIYEWMIYKFEIDIDNFSIICRNRKALMDRKTTLEQKVYVSETVEFILDDITWDWNTEFSELWTHNWASLATVPFTIDTTEYTIDTTNITIDTTLLWFTLSATFEYWTSWSEILDMIADLTSFYRYLDWNQITFAERLWEDKTSWQNYTEYLYIRWDSALSNISNARLEYYGQITNFLIATNTTNAVQAKNQDSIDEYGQVLGWVEEFYWNLSQNITKHFSRYATEQDVIEIETNPFSPEANIGDLCVLEINGVNDYMDRKTNITIITKNTTYINWTKIVRLTWSDVVINKPTANKRIKKIENWQKYLLLKA